MPDSSPQARPSAARNLYSFGLTSFFNDTATEMAYWVLPAFLASLEGVTVEKPSARIRVFKEADHGAQAPGR